MPQGQGTQTTERPFDRLNVLGVQNTAQYLTAAAAAPVAGLAISQWGYAAAFGLAALFPVLAVGLVPREDQTAP